MFCEHYHINIKYITGLLLEQSQHETQKAVTYQINKLTSVTDSTSQRGYRDLNQPLNESPSKLMLLFFSC